MSDTENLSAAPSSLYDRIGGEFTLNAAIDRFYEKMANEKRLALFFENISFERQIRKQKAFMRMVMGKTSVYEGKSLRDAHRPLIEKGLNDTHIDIFIGHFADTLRELGVEESLIKEVIALADSYRNEVLNR